MEANEKVINEQEVNKKEETLVYKRRFWMLALFAFSATLNVTIWGTFGPIMESVKYAYDWSDIHIALISSWTTTMSIVFSFPFALIVRKYGLRIAMLTVSSCVFIGSGLRCISTETVLFTFTANICGILNGVASCITLALPSQLSSVWFPTSERTTATALGFMAHRLGGIGMYLSPLLVKTPEEIEINAYNASNSSLTVKEELKQDIRNLMFIHFGLAAVLFLCSVFSFQKAPVNAPTMSSYTKRMDFQETFRSLIKNRNAVLAITVFVGSMSIPFPWITVMNFSLNCLGIGQRESMWIAISMIIGCMICTFCVARITDKFYGHLRVSLIILLSISWVFYLWFALLTFNIIESPSNVQIYIAVIGAMATQFGSIPIMSELIVELSYPCPENVLGSIETFLMDSLGAIFLLLLMIETECYRWVSIVFVIGGAVVILPLLFLKEEYRRSTAEVTPNKVAPPELKKTIKLK